MSSSAADVVNQSVPRAINLRNGATAGVVPTVWDQWLAKLATFATLEPGWDSYKASPPSAETISAASSFLTAIRTIGMSPTGLTPSVVGGVGFTFEKGPREVYVEFRNTGNAHAAFLDNASESEPEVIKVQQDTTGYTELMGKVESYLHEQTARCIEG